MHVVLLGSGGAVGTVGTDGAVAGAAVAGRGGVARGLHHVATAGGVAVVAEITELDGKLLQAGDFPMLRQNILACACTLLENDPQHAPGSPGRKKRPL